MTYRVEPLCGHPRLMGGMHDHGPGCLFLLTPEQKPTSPPVVTWAWAEGMTVETARRVAQEALAKVTP